MSFGSNGVHRVRSLRKIPTRRCVANLCDNGTSSAYFCIDFCALIKRSGMPRNMSFGSISVSRVRSLQNAPKHEFWVQWSGSGAFVAKNSDETIFSELVP
jgi:hypothetical protein